MGGVKTYLFIGLVLLYTVIGGMSGCVWSAWVSELLPPRRRGLYFGIRNQRTHTAHFFSLLLAGFILQKIEEIFSNSTGTQFAFTLVFLVGLIAKLFSFFHLYSQPDTPFIPKSNVPRPVEFIRKSYEDQKSRRTFYFFGTMGLAISIFSPFQTPYLRQVLHLSYFHFSFAIAVYVGARFLAAPLVGKMVDSSGSRQLLLISSMLMPWIPLGWSLSENYGWILIVQFLGGLIWAAFDLCAFTFLAETTPSCDRQHAFSVKQIAWNLGSSMGVILGGVLIHFFGKPYILFFASCVARGTAAYLVLKMIEISTPSPSVETVLPNDPAVIRDAA
jgi:MFS family permease